MGWQAVHAGGGTATGEGYVLSGSIGQVESGEVVVGGDYTWRGGFWTAWAGVVENQEAPRLVISWSGDGLILSWTEGVGVYTLQESGDLEAGDWVISGVENGVPLAPSSGRAVYYRLVVD